MQIYTNLQPSPQKEGDTYWGPHQDEARYSPWKVGVAGSHCVCRPAWRVRCQVSSRWHAPSMELSSEILWRVCEKNNGDGWDANNENTPEPRTALQNHTTILYLFLMWLHYLIHVIQTRSILLWSVVCAFVGWWGWSWFVLSLSPFLGGYFLPCLQIASTWKIWRVSDVRGVKLVSRRLSKGTKKERLTLTRASWSEGAGGGGERGNRRERFWGITRVIDI
jgi:hypothetical protein